MEFLLLGEPYAGTGIAEFNIQLTDIFMDYFKEKSYSSELNAVVLFFICRPGRPYRQRPRYYPVKRVFLVDIMLDFDFAMSATDTEKKKYYFESFNQLYPILQRHKKKIKDLKIDELKIDLNALLSLLQAAS